MDTSDPEITFDSVGHCNHCRRFTALKGTLLFRTDRERQEALDQLVSRIRRAGRGHEYDCVIGVSGGVDSTYVAYLVTKVLGLRPLAVHMDNGWNSTLAVTNIERSLSRLGVDLHTVVLDWEEFRELQLAFLRASTPDSEVPTDHAIGAVLMETAIRHRIRYVLSGSNFATEGIMPTSWVRGIGDWRYIKGISAQFGSRPLRTFPHYTLWDRFTFALRGHRFIRILNYVSYSKAAAMQTIERELGWSYYGGKHYESIFTRFLQGHILPTKFGIDKRRAHLSTLIVSGELDRDTALREIATPAYASALLAEDRAFVLKKLRLSDDAFSAIMAAPPRRFSDYDSYESAIGFRILRGLYRRLRLRSARRRAGAPEASAG